MSKKTNPFVAAFGLFVGGIFVTAIGGGTGVGGIIALGVILILAGFITFIVLAVKSGAANSKPQDPPPSGYSSEYNPYAPPDKPGGNSGYNPYGNYNQNNANTSSGQNAPKPNFDPMTGKPNYVQNQNYPYGQPPKPIVQQRTPQSLAEALKAREEMLRKQRAAELREEQQRRIEEARKEAERNYRIPKDDIVDVPPREEAADETEEEEVLFDLEWDAEEEQDEESEEGIEEFGGDAEADAEEDFEDDEELSGDEETGEDADIEYAEDEEPVDGEETELPAVSADDETAELEFEAETEKANLAVWQSGGDMETGRVVSVESVSQNYARVTFMIQNFDGVSKRYAITKKDSKFTADSAHYLILDKQDKDRCAVV